MTTVHLSEARLAHNPRMSRVIERILNLLAFLLTVGRPVSAEEIRYTVAGYDQPEDEAFRRMFERDKELLRQLGIALELQPTDVWAVDFGYVVPEDGYQLPDPGLNDEERAALWLAAQVVQLGGQPSGPEALFKLGGAPGTLAGDPLAANLGDESGVLGELFGAVVEHRRVEFDYRDKPRILLPYGLVHRRGHWYLVGRADEEIRAFRVDRMGRPAIGEEADAFTRPKGFRVDQSIPDAPWEAGSDDITAQVVFSSEVAWWAQRQLSANAEVTEHEDGSLQVELPVANPDAFIGWVLGFVDEAEVIGPPELREKVLARAEGKI